MTTNFRFAHAMHCATDYPFYSNDAHLTFDWFPWARSGSGNGSSSAGLKQTNAMNTTLKEAKSLVADPTPEVAMVTPARTPALILLALPVATLLAFVVHLSVSKNQLPAETRSYSLFLGLIFLLAALGGVLQFFWQGLRRWMVHMCPIIAAALVLCAFWELITSGLHWLPMPYFPGPAGVLYSLITERSVLFDSAWHSFILLLSGYALGVAVALVTGICIGWFAPARYWGMPLLKVIGPIPATAWIPLAMVLSPSATISAIGLIALAVWFPVTMLTASGISNTRASYLDVARTLGAKPSYLIFKVAIPAALPSIFIGLFMGLGASFLTLVVAETVGVKSGLGWYVSWAQGWAEYGKVYAALVIMAAFFSSIMTVLFKVRDQMLDWQKGVIKW
jgi:NitT/TauT family transport system permease protein